MSREIKFRAWDKEEKRMIYLARSMSSSTYLQINNHSWGLFEPDRENYHGMCTCNSNMGDILMQYTGLKDKNGKEIYEGDILKSSCRLFEIKWNQYLCAFDSEFVKYINMPDVNFKGIKPLDWSSLEVIGNIYENQEFLESED